MEVVHNTQEQGSKNVIHHQQQRFPSPDCQLPEAQFWPLKYSVWLVSEAGDRIVKVQDDSAAISVSKKISSAITRNKRVQEIAGNAIGFLKLQQGALQEIQKTIDRMSELKAMSVDETQNANDINNYNAEFHELQQHLRGVRDLKFNSTNVFVTEGRDIQMLSTEVGEQGNTQIDRVYISGNAGDKLTLNVDGSNFTFDIGTATEIQDDINASNLGDIFLAKNADDGNGFFELEARKYNNRYSLNTEYPYLVVPAMPR